MKLKRSFGKRVISVVLCLVLILGVMCMGGCGASGSDSSGGSYTVWLYSAQDSEYYKDYADNPVLKYLLSQEEWSNISLEFDVPAAGTAQDNYSTLITSGDFPTLMQNSVSDTAPIMYENGYIIDLTELVEEYIECGVQSVSNPVCRDYRVQPADCDCIPVLPGKTGEGNTHRWCEGLVTDTMIFANRLFPSCRKSKTGSCRM